MLKINAEVEKLSEFKQKTTLLEARFTTQNYSGKQLFRITACHGECIIGMNMINKHRMWQDVNHNIHIEGQLDPRTICKPNSRFIVQPRQQSMITVHYEADIKSQEIFFEPTNSLPRDLIVESSFHHNTDSKTIQVAVSNYSNKSIKINTRSKLGSVSDAISTLKMQTSELLNSQLTEVQAQTLKDNINKELSANQKTQIFKTLTTRDAVFSDKLKLFNVEETHEIVTTGLPPKQSPHKTSPEKARILEEKVQKLLEKGIIEHSKSPCSSPALVVKKKGTYK